MGAGGAGIQESVNTGQSNPFVASRTPKPAEGTRSTYNIIGIHRIKYIGDNATN